MLVLTEGTSNPTANDEPETDSRGFIVWPNQHAAVANSAPHDVGEGGADSAQAQRAVAALTADTADVQVQVVQTTTATAATN